MRVLFAVAALAWLGCARVPAESRASKSEAPAMVRELAQDVGARFSGTPGNTRAIAWAVEKMKALGLANVRAEPVTVPHWDRGAESGELTAPTRRKLWLTALGGSVGTADGGVEAEVIEVDSLPALAALPDEKVRGKIVFFNQTPARNRDGTGYRDTVPIRRNGPSAAGKKGAVAMVMRSVSTATTGAPHTGGTLHAADTLRIPAAALAVEDAALLHEQLLQGPVRLRLSLGCRDLPPEQSANVIGEVPGTDLASELILIGAHLDSWDITPGAMDDGAGVAIVLDVARALKGLQPRRTVRVVLFANEEFGLDGAETYVVAHKDELDRHVLALEMDAGGGRVFAISYLAGPEAEAPMLAAAAGVLPLGVSVPARGDAHGSDLYPLRKAGVPVMDLRQDASSYFDVHHSADDTWERTDLPALEQAVTAVTAFVAAISQSAAELGRIPADKR